MLTSDWNVNFQRLLQMSDSHTKFRLLSELAQDFNFAASLYGMIIINKVNLPPEKKTVKPTNLGGVAGGTKFIVNNILFKFALDFGGLCESDEDTMKAASHDKFYPLVFLTSEFLYRHISMYLFLCCGLTIAMPS